MRSAPLACLVAIVTVAACTSTVRGNGDDSGTPSSAVSSSTTAPSTGVSSSSATPPPADIARSVVQTVIGDPVTADLCTAIGLDPLRGLGTGLTPSFDTRQFPPGCSMTLGDATKAVLNVSVYADQDAPRKADGRTTHQESGQRVYVYPFDSTTGSCERELKADTLRLVVDAFPPNGQSPDQTMSCGATDAVANRLAGVVVAGSVPRLPLATPSLSALDGCKIVGKTDITTLAAFTGSRVVSRGFGVNCELKPKTLFLFFNFEIADVAQPRGSTPTTVEGHQLYETTAQGDFCSYASTQGTTADGRYEQVAAAATVVGASTPPAQLCEQTAQALARYLTAAGLS